MAEKLKNFEASSRYFPLFFVSCKPDKIQSGFKPFTKSKVAAVSAQALGVPVEAAPAFARS